MRTVHVEEAPLEDDRERLDFIDKRAPYYRWCRGYGPGDEQVLGHRERDRGQWLDLAPSDANDVCINDGNVRGYLDDLGIHKSEWERATPKARKKIIAVIRALDVAGEAIRNVLLWPGEKSGKSALRLISNLEERLISAAEGKRSFAALRRNFQAHADARRLIVRLRPALEHVQHRAGRKNNRFLPEWNQAQAGHINRLLEKAGLECTPCSAEHIALLQTKSATVVACEMAGATVGLDPKELVRRARRDR